MRLKNFVYILALFMVLLCCFSAVSASENVNETMTVSDDVAMDEVVSEVDSDDESISVQENEEIESSDDVDNESLEVSDVEEVDDVDDSSSVLSAEENDNEVSGQTHYIIDNKRPLVWSNLDSDLYGSPILVNLTSWDNLDHNPKIYYSLNESNFMLYENILSISKTTSLRFYAIDFNGHKSEVITCNYI